MRDLPPRDRIQWLIDREAGTVRLEQPEPALVGRTLPLAPMIRRFGVALTWQFEVVAVGVEALVQLDVPRAA